MKNIYVIGSRWNYEGKAFTDDAPIYYTIKNELKIKVIIANLLYKYHIPYRYEFPVTIKDFGITYPDFMVLNVPKEIYIEHFGLLDDVNYRENVIRKIIKRNGRNLPRG